MSLISGLISITAHEICYLLHTSLKLGLILRGPEWGDRAQAVTRNQLSQSNNHSLIIVNLSLFYRAVKFWVLLDLMHHAALYLKTDLIYIGSRSETNLGHFCLFSSFCRLLRLDRFLLYSSHTGKFTRYSSIKESVDTKKQKELSITYTINKKTTNLQTDNVQKQAPRMKKWRDMKRIVM